MCDLSLHIKQNIYWDSMIKKRFSTGSFYDGGKFAYSSWTSSDGSKSYVRPMIAF